MPVSHGNIILVSSQGFDAELTKECVSLFVSNNVFGIKLHFVTFVKHLSIKYGQHIHRLSMLRAGCLHSFRAGAVSRGVHQLR